MHICEKGLALICSFEGFADKPYICAGGKHTIGYGHVIGQGEVWHTITHDEAMALLQQDAALAGRQVSRLLPIELKQGQFSALVSFVFNLGAGAFQRSTLRQVLLRGEWESVPRQWLRWHYAGGKPMRGLLKRREAELSLFFSE